MQQIGTEGVQGETLLGGQGDPLGNVQEIYIWHHAHKWYMHNPAPVQENDAHKLPWDFDIQTDHLNSARPYNNQQTKENLQNCRLCCPGRPQNKTERMWKER